MSLLKYTTTVPPSQTLAEIQEMLVQHGVTGVMTEYEGPQVAAVSFKIKAGDRDMAFRLPCNWRMVLQVFHDQGITKVKHRDKSLENQAVRTAWRIIHEWIGAQLALVEVNMATLPQIFLPYTIMRDNRTLAEHVASNPSFLLGSGEQT